MEKRGLMAGLIILALAASLAVGFAAQHLQGSAVTDRLQARQALLEALGFASLAVSSECTLVRSLMEGLNGCLGDVPGGYCTYTSCDVVTLPDFASGAVR